MNIVVFETKADQHGVETKRALEIGDDRDRGARANQQRLLAPLLGKRAPRGGKRLHVPVERYRRPAGMVAELGAAILRQPHGHVVTERLADLEGILALDETERDLRGSFRRNNGFRALAGVTADDAVDVAGRTRGDLLDQQTIFLAGGD